MLKTALVTDRRYLDHFAGRHHPEGPERLQVLLEMAQAATRPALIRIAPRPATVAELELCHQADYVAAVGRSATVESYAFDPDTHACAATYRTALLAAGGALTAAQAVLEGDADNAFALVRPPGHHALAGRAMGFCFFNNAAIAAAWLSRVKQQPRVMIIDWDVHHGNGTQDLFYDSSQVLYCSTHQYPHYPGTGAIGETGRGEGRGFTVNLPMPAGFGDDDYLCAFDRVILPLGRSFRPDFIIVSAGFDCHYRDPLADMAVTEPGFAAMTRRIKRLAAECCGGKFIVLLEGGYDLQALGRSAQAVLEELGREADEPYHQPLTHRARSLAERVQRELEPFWQLDV